VFVRVLFLLGVSIAGGAFWGGLAYYLTPLGERPFSPLHELYAPTGLIGQGFGVVGTLMILLGVGLYSLRKRVRALSRVGTLKSWLHFHIFLCLLGPFLVLLHTTFRFGGLVAIAFWSMAMVVASGVFGRWIYVWIPKTVNGRFLQARELQDQMRGLLEDVEAGLRLPAAQVLELLDIGSEPASDGPSGIVSAVGLSVRHRWTRRRDRTRIERHLSAAGVPEPTRAALVDRLQEDRLRRQQAALIRPFQRAFRYWHAFHLPLAVVMLLVLIVHVGVAVAFGYTWIFG